MNKDTQVAIIGAGPVGLTLAIDLAQRGIDVLVIERGDEAAAGDAKCNTVSARTMEVFRRLGIAEVVRSAGLPDDYPTDAVFSTGFDGQELARIKLPSRKERMGPDGHSAPGFPDSDWLTPEPVVRVSQYFLNPILYQCAREFSEITLLSGVEFTGYEQGENEVDVLARVISTGEQLRVNAKYLVGCDGGRSTVRKQMGVSFLGDAQLGRTRSTLVRCPAIRQLYTGRPGWMNWIRNDKVSRICVAIDGDELWLLHRSVPADADDFTALDADQSIRDLLGVDEDFSWEVLKHVDWTARRLVAERFNSGRVFIEGDAAHIWIPMAGYGMNAGVADATNLAWMMAAVLNGYAPVDMLDAHQIERHPISEQVSRLAMNKALELAERPDTPEKILQINVPQFVCEGLNFGYFYDNSPLIVYDEESPPAYDMGSAQPSTVPGCRLPHFWIDSQTSIYDTLGPYYSLLQFRGNTIDAVFADAFENAGMPLTVLDVDADADYFKHKFLLVRSDQHICWRGNGLPDMTDLIAVVTGHNMP